MSKPDPAIAELATLVRGALALADEHRLFAVGADLDSALLKLVAMDRTGSIAPQPYEPDWVGETVRGIARSA